MSVKVYTNTPSEKLLDYYSADNLDIKSAQSQTIRSPESTKSYKLSPKKVLRKLSVKFADLTKIKRHKSNFSILHSDLGEDQEIIDP